MSSIGVGIIGAGGIAHAHAKAYRNNDNARLVGFADVNPEAAERAAGEFGAESMSVENLLRDPRIQAVSICTPPVSHASLAIEALAAGKHILIEKPVCTTMDDVRRIVQAEARSNGLKVMVAHSHRYWPKNQRAKEIIASGEIGEIVMVRDEIISSSHFEPGNLPWRFKKAIAGGGVAMDNGIHAVDRLRYWLERRATSVDARMWRIVEGADVEDAVVASVYFDGASGDGADDGPDPAAHVYLNRAAAKVSGRCVAEFLGTEGSLVVETWGELRWCRQGEEWRIEPAQAGPNAFDLEVEAFLASVIHDKPSPVTVEDAAESLRIVLAMYESAERGARVYL